MKIPNSYDFGNALRASGWKRPSSDARVVTVKEFTTYIKRVGGVWVQALVSDSLWSDAVFIHANPSNYNVLSMTEDQKDSLRGTTQFDEGTIEEGVAAVEREAKRVAAAAKKLSGPRKRDYSHLSYYPPELGGYERVEGRAALDAWKERIEEHLVEEFSHGSYKAFDTSFFVENALDNFSIEPPSGVSRAEASRMIRAALEKLAKQGKAEKLTGGRAPLWKRKE